MSEIPDDITKVAARIENNLDRNLDHNGRYVDRLAIAKAIYAERLRCAEIAAEYGDDWTAACEISRAILGKDDGR